MRWSYIESGHGNAFDNMAVDEAIFAVSQRAYTLPVLRLYGWSPDALSIGYFQSAREVDHVRRSRRDLDLVRRSTGGAAILHSCELTFSICIDVSGATRQGATEWVYAEVNAALLRALQRLGVEAHARGDTGHPTPRSRPTPFCFARPSRFDLMVGDRKLVGSAQRRRGSLILQHGSIPLRESGLAPRAVSVEAAAGRNVAFGEAARAIRLGFESHFGAAFMERTLRADEQQLAQRLSADKYRADHWTFKR